MMVLIIRKKILLTNLSSCEKTGNSTPITTPMTIETKIHLVKDFSCQPKYKLAATKNHLLEIKTPSGNPMPTQGRNTDRQHRVVAIKKAQCEEWKDFIL